MYVTVARSKCVCIAMTRLLLNFHFLKTAHFSVTSQSCYEKKGTQETSVIQVYNVEVII